MLDTSTVILLGRIDDPAALPDEAVISAITLAELSVGPHVAHTDEERAARQAHLQQAESDFDVLVFDAESARAFGSVAASLRASGRKPAARAYDALIAASAGTPTEHQPGNGPAKKLRIQSTHSAEERGLDPYFTCPEATLSLLHSERKFLPHRLWDPGAGDGAITNVLQAHGFSTYASDIEGYGLKGCVIEDFFTIPAPPGVEGIVTNPPFRLAQRFIEKALHEVGYAAFLLRSNFLVEGERRDKFLESHPPDSRLLLVTALPDDAPLWLDWEAVDLEHAVRVGDLGPPRPSHRTPTALSLEGNCSRQHAFGIAREWCLSDADTDSPSRIRRVVVWLGLLRELRAARRQADDGGRKADRCR